MKKPLEMPWPLAVPLAVLLSCGVTLLALWCQPNNLPEVLALFQEVPARFALNTVPMFLLLLLFSFLFGNLFHGAAAAVLLTGLFAIANRVKIQVRDEPVFPRDIALLKEVGSAVGNYDIRIPAPLIVTVLASTVLLALLGLFVGHRAGPGFFRGWLGRLSGAATSLTVLAALTVTVYSSDSLYNSLPVSSPYRLSVAFNENGFPYSFFHQVTKYQVDRPAGYSKGASRAWDEGTRDWREGLEVLASVRETSGATDSKTENVPGNTPEIVSGNMPGNTPANVSDSMPGNALENVSDNMPGNTPANVSDNMPGNVSENVSDNASGSVTGGGVGVSDTAEAHKPVHVVMVMNEAFSDITDDPAFAFTAKDDPLRNLHAIQSDPHGLALRLVVPGFAGGTANTEFDVLTGIQTNALGEGTSSAMRTVNRNLDSLFRVFRADGYRASFFHPGDDWFYNRENVFRWLGAEETVFVDQMENPPFEKPEYKGRWVTDKYMARLIETELDRAVSDGNLLFHNTTTIQNHMSYYWDKYGEGYSFPFVALNREVSDDVDIMLRVYVEGVRDADAMLGELRDNFAAREEPVLLVFYGDHLPYLGDNQMCYAALGMDAALPDGERTDPFSIYETPCVLWANEAAAAVLDWENAVRSLGLPENRKLSAAFLGPLLLELTGRRDAAPWTAFLNELRRAAPVVQRNQWQHPDGTVEDAVDGTPLEPWVRRWRQWSYYRLEQKTIR